MRIPWTGLLLNRTAEPGLRIRDRESMLIKKIRKSLEDIENGDYGICEDCGKDISTERLKARPVTSFCIRCKTKRETLEKLTGK